MVPFEEDLAEHARGGGGGGAGTAGQRRGPTGLPPAASPWSSTCGTSPTWRPTPTRRGSAASSAEDEPELPSFDGEAVAAKRKYRALRLRDGIKKFAEARERNLAALGAVPDGGLAAYRHPGGCREGDAARHPADDARARPRRTARRSKRCWTSSRPGADQSIFRRCTRSLQRGSERSGMNSQEVFRCFSHGAFVR